MTTLVALNAKIRGDASGFILATNKAGAAADKLAQKVGGTGPKGVTGATTKLTGAFKKLSSGNAMRMLPMQFSQVAQQAAAGTGVMRARTIQAADIGLAFGTVGTIVGILATVAMPVLIGMFSSAGSEAEDLEKALEGFTGQLSKVSRAAEIAQTPIEELRKTYGRFAEEIQRTSRIAAKAALGAAMREYRDATAELTPFLTDLTSATAAYAREAEIMKTTLDVLGTKTLRNASTWDEAEAAVERARAKVVEVAGTLNMTAGEADLLQHALNRMAGAEGPEDLAEAAGSVLSAFDAFYETALEIPPEVQLIIDHLRTVQLEAAAAKENFEAMGDAARSVRVGGGGGGRGDPREFTNMDEFREQLAGQNGEEDEDDKKKGGLSEEERELAKTEADFERLQDKFRTELELEAKHYAAQQQLLNEALDAELLTREEYDSLNEQAKKAHLDKMAQIDAYNHGTTLQATEQFLGDMAGALGSGNEKMLEISKKFGAAQALISAWQGAAEALKKPWPLNLLAFTQVMAQGLAAVSAIKGVSASGGGGGGGGASPAPATAGAVEGGGAVPQQRSLTLIGDRFNRQQAVSIAEFMNEGADDGLVIKGAR